MKARAQPTRRRILPRAPAGRYRTPMGTAALDTLEHAIRTEARRFNVSCSFVIHTAVAYALGLEVEDYRTTDKVIPITHHKRRRAG